MRWRTTCIFTLALIGSASGQFKELGPAPLPPAAARQKIRASLEAVTASNRQKTIETLLGLVAWYRDVIDDELIAAWQLDSRSKLTEVIRALPDARIATGIIEYSWRKQRQATFTPSNAPLLGELMALYSISAQPFLQDLLGTTSAGYQLPQLSSSEIEAVCRILLDMPDIGNWRSDGLKILPRYSEAAHALLVQDTHGEDQEKRYRAEMWLTDLHMDAPEVTNKRQNQRRIPAPSPPVPADPAPVAVSSANTLPSRLHVSGPPMPAENQSLPASPLPVAAAAAPSAPSPPSTLAYTGVKSGTLESSGNSVPQNAEYVFRNLPLIKMQLDYDTKIWEARLMPAEGNTQKLIVRNKSAGPQKRCVVHWKAVP